jgi:hypothetical protein
MHQGNAIDMNPAITNFPFLPLFIDIGWGLLGLTVVLIFHGSAINHLIMKFERHTKKNLELKQYNRVFTHFYLTFIYIALIHITEILIWSFYIVQLNLISDPVKAVLFAGSCYTTVGFIEDILPAGWRSLAFFISFTGLFSLAWTTSVMIGMSNTYKDAWRQKYEKYLL